jgi:hypothetical protein
MHTVRIMVPYLSSRFYSRATLDLLQDGCWSSCSIEFSVLEVTDVLSMLLHGVKFRTHNDSPSLRAE